MGKKASDVAEERPFWGVHILATAVMCAAGATADELELAKRLLARDPRVDAPREAESVAGCFNRHMDAALDSANDSIGNPSRASRRALLAADLSRADVVMVDRAAIAALITTIDDLRTERDALLNDVVRLEGSDLGADLAVDAMLEEMDLQRAIDARAEQRYNEDPLGLELATADALNHGFGVLRLTDAGAGEHVPLDEFYELNPSVND